MKNIIVVTILSTLSLSAFAQIPQDLENLIPVGTSSLQLTGKTQDNKNCIVNLGINSFSYSASLAVLDKQGAVDTARFGTFQVGLGHDLQSVEKQGNNIVAVSIHGAEESYSSDSRTTLKVNKSDDTIKAVQVIVERKGFFGFKTKVKETCVFN